VWRDCIAASCSLRLGACRCCFLVLAFFGTRGADPVHLIKSFATTHHTANTANTAGLSCRERVVEV
jgi:hypothetical protein